MSGDLRAIKNELRRRAYAARNAQPGKEALSAVIRAAFIALPEYRRAKTVMWYLHCRSEVRTRPAVAEALSQGKRLVIPYCTKDGEGRNKLGLWRLESMDELVRGTWNILEPPKERRGEAGKEVSPLELDLIIVPGVAFDRRGGRLGNGRGYYDRLLKQVRPDAVLAAVCYESQIFEEVPMGPDDIFMHKLLTEKTEYRCR